MSNIAFTNNNSSNNNKSHQLELAKNCDANWGIFRQLSGIDSYYVSVYSSSTCCLTSCAVITGIHCSLLKQQLFYVRNACIYVAGLGAVIR